MFTVIIVSSCNFTQLHEYYEFTNLHCSYRIRGLRGLGVVTFKNTSTFYMCITINSNNTNLINANITPQFFTSLHFSCNNIDSFCARNQQRQHKLI